MGEQLSPIAKPDEIRLTDNLPKTRSGKIMRRLLRAIARGEQITQDMSTLENPAILEQLRGGDAPAAATKKVPKKAPPATAAKKPVSGVKKSAKKAPKGLAKAAIRKRSAMKPRSKPKAGRAKVAAKGSKLRTKGRATRRAARKK